ncbi:hypothetical protein [Pandoraea sputorum]|uniref:Uncharacterized protein n=1 Tax=Pandoraea sputorum TaxID=93222 RepID=A0A5E5BE09_9BURK|nr:hypothetical protein [Pandoraea sputorum]VVE84441.1 hypothetical protein PSP31121_04764 [Pandoraea sputorum]
MRHISGNTFFRAFSVVSAPGESDLAQAAGNYENTRCTKVVKGLVGMLTLGIGYGILYIVEDSCNVVPKIEEFREAAVKLYRAIEASPLQRGGRAQVSVRTRDDREIKFCETERGVDIEDADGHVSELRGLTLARIREKLALDFAVNLGAYARYGKPEARESAEARRPRSADSGVVPGIGPWEPPFVPLLGPDELSAEPPCPLSDGSDSVGGTARRDPRFAPLARPDSTRVTQCPALQAFIPLALRFLSEEGQQHYSADVANFLIGNVNQLPAGLALPDPAIPDDVRGQLGRWLPMSANVTPGVILGNIRMLGKPGPREDLGDLEDLDGRVSGIVSVVGGIEDVPSGRSVPSSHSSTWGLWA